MAWLGCSFSGQRWQLQTELLHRKTGGRIKQRLQTLVPFASGVVENKWTASDPRQVRLLNLPSWKRLETEGLPNGLQATCAKGF